MPCPKSQGTRDQGLGQYPVVSEFKASVSRQAPVPSHWSLVTLFLVLAGCATAPPPPTDLSAICHEVFRRVDRAVAEAGVADGMAARVAGFPYLRVNRFLASYAEEELDDARFAEWMNQMVTLGTHAWAIEIANLPAELAEALGHELWKLSVKVAWA